MVDLSIVIVSWNVWPQLQACLASIARASRPAPGEAQARLFGPGAAPRTLEVVVVDNLSQDDTVQQLPQLFPWVRVIVADANLGFTRGNNVGYAASTGRLVFFLNPDTELDGGQGVHGDSLWQLASAIERDPAVGVIGPQLRYADGSPQPSVRRFPTRLTGFFESTWLGRAWPANPWSRRLHMVDWQVDFEHDVDWIVGAAMFCRRAALEQTRTPAGPFDERFFMYSEELDLCMRLKAAGWRVVYEPRVIVMHYEGKSSEQVSAARHIHFNTSKVRYYEKWFSPTWAKLLRRYLLFEFRLQLWQEQVKLRLGHKPALRSDRIAAYKSVIASGLK